MGFVDYVKQGIEIAKLNKKAITSAAADPKAFGMAILIILISSVLSYIGTIRLAPFSVLGLITTLILGIVGAFIGVFILHILSLLFGGKAKYSALFKAMGLSYVLAWLSVLRIIPVAGGLINFLVGIWSIVVAVVVIKEVHKLTTMKAVLVILIPLIVVIIIGIVVGMAALAALGIRSVA